MPTECKASSAPPRRIDGRKGRLQFEGLPQRIGQLRYGSVRPTGEDELRSVLAASG